MNQEIYPSVISPLSGDVTASPGQPTVTVTGIQQQAVDPAQPVAKQLLVFGSDGIWHPEDPVVSGTDAPGTISTANPVQIAGIDDGGLVREILTDNAGGVRSLRLEDLIYSLLLEVRAMKNAIIALDNTLNPVDFEAAGYVTDDV
jgi:hypothetical protein